MSLISVACNSLMSSMKQDTKDIALHQEVRTKLRFVSANPIQSKSIIPNNLTSTSVPNAQERKKKFRKIINSQEEYT